MICLLFSGNYLNVNPEKQHAGILFEQRKNSKKLEILRVVALTDATAGKNVQWGCFTQEFLFKVGKAMRKWYFWENSWGQFCLVEEQQAIVKLCIPGEKMPKEEACSPDVLQVEAAKQIDEYLCGERREFSVPLAPRGTTFQLQVWQELLRIPYGETRSYQQCAVKLGSPGACRAVGMACNRNPLPLFIPCHRVLAKNGALQGFRAGLDMKIKLLQLEQNQPSPSPEIKNRRTPYQPP